MEGELGVIGSRAEVSSVNVSGSFESKVVIVRSGSSSLPLDFLRTKRPSLDVEPARFLRRFIGSILLLLKELEDLWKCIEKA